MNKVVGWVFIVVGGVAAFIGVLALVGNETGDGTTLLGVGALLTLAGWAVCSARGAAEVIPHRMFTAAHRAAMTRAIAAATTAEIRAVTVAEAMVVEAANKFRSALRYWRNRSRYTPCLHASSCKHFRIEEPL